MKKNTYILEVGLGTNNPKDKWGEIKEKDIIDQYMRISKDFIQENKNIVGVFGNYTKFLETVNNNLLFFGYLVLEIETKNVIFEDDAGNNLNYHFDERRG